MKTYTFRYSNSLPEEIEVEANNPNKAFDKVVKLLKEELESNCFGGDLNEE